MTEVSVLSDQHIVMINYLRKNAAMLSSRKTETSLV